MKFPLWSKPLPLRVKQEKEKVVLALPLLLLLPLVLLQLVLPLRLRVAKNPSPFTPFWNLLIHPWIDSGPIPPWSGDCEAMTLPFLVSLLFEMISIPIIAVQWKH